MPCGNNTKIEGLDITLDDLASLNTQTGSDQWLDVSV